MDTTSFNRLVDALVANAIPIAYKLVGVILLWVIGRIAVNVMVRTLSRSLKKRAFDPTLTRYIESIAQGGLTFLLVVAMLSVLGVETTSFAALLAALGLAIGTAWGGLLSNFAAGVFLVVLRPFRVGEMITAGGVTGVVHEIGLFVTVVDGADNVRQIIGNAKIFSDNIVNYTVNPYRRVELKAQLPHGVDPRAAMKLLRERLPSIPFVVNDPAPQVELLEFNLAGPVLAVRPFCHNNNYWDVYFKTNELIAEVFTQAGFPVPSQHRVVVAG